MWAIWAFMRFGRHGVDGRDDGSGWWSRLGKWVPSAAVSIEFEMVEGSEIPCGEGMLLKVWSQDHRKMTALIFIAKKRAVKSVSRPFNGSLRDNADVCVICQADLEVS